MVGMLFILTSHVPFLDSNVHSKLNLALSESQAIYSGGFLLFCTIVFKVLSTSIATLNGWLSLVVFHSALL